MDRIAEVIGLLADIDEQEKAFRVELGDRKIVLREELRILVEEAGGKWTDGKSKASMVGGNPKTGYDSSKVDSVIMGLDVLDTKLSKTLDIIREGKVKPADQIWTIQQHIDALAKLRKDLIASRVEGTTARYVKTEFN